MVQRTCMDIVLYNSLTKQKEPFSPLHTGKVNMYSCGPTVYKSVTIGNLRSYLFADMLRRMFEFNGYEVKHVMNITDVGHLTDDGNDGEDKMEREAEQSRETAWDIAERYTNEFLENASELNMKKFAFLPRATEHIAEQIAFIEELERRGYTYVIGDGVYFDTATLPEYGALFGGQELSEKEEGARVRVNDEKRNASDFALWKFSPKEGKRQMEWESPWGVGFPGWHIECSAMSEHYLDAPFDVHTGGRDLIPVHHTNEMAQTLGARGCVLARYWLHNGFLQVDGGKMSKSLGNTYSLADLMERGFDPLAFRLFTMSAHYRTPLNFTFEALESSQNALRRLQRTVRAWKLADGAEPDHETVREFRKAINDDLDIPGALRALWSVVDSDLAEEQKSATVIVMDAVFGLGLRDIVGKQEEVPADIRGLLREREEARIAKDFDKSDKLRDQIRAMGWMVKDEDGGQSVERL